MYFKTICSIIATLALTTTVLAVPAAIPDLAKKDTTSQLLERQVITCGYYEVCYCPRNGVRFTCRDPQGCSMTCYPA
ncbi:uncharacterized protein I303_104699 [Kwoniella dejecticola CBS 10117]|uniref:Uncharacterized protein n=1 Tax=Kwoniella dejecticola CBS 10117 TaxID=1296121 RepID=A0A1A6A4K6_9TREE|nr:uncharacterized protein I303_04322 [Kwoniella dejecticola CBS 10117]OBR84995.1 hypothetical protein I303_04322 [Kwoniella dejecticola CBS 10117]